MYFNHIKTSEKNHLRIKELTNKLQFGSENVIARLAFCYSLASGEKLSIESIQNSKGKEYSARVLFGVYIDEYVYLICTHYSLYIMDSDLPKYIKLHLDHGIETLHTTLEQNPIQLFMFLPKSSNSLFLLAEKLIGIARVGKKEISSVFKPKIIKKK